MVTPPSPSPRGGGGRGLESRTPRPHDKGGSAWLSTDGRAGQGALRPTEAGRAGSRLGELDEATGRSGRGLGLVSTGPCWLSKDGLPCPLQPKQSRRSVSAEETSQEPPRAPGRREGCFRRLRLGLRLESEGQSVSPEAPAWALPARSTARLPWPSAPALQPHVSLPPEHLPHSAKTSLTPDQAQLLCHLLEHLAWVPYKSRLTLLMVAMPGGHHHNAHAQ